MIFGAPSTFAVEAIPGKGWGANVAGRFRVHIGGTAIGDFEEPDCWLGPFSQHLLRLAAASGALWHQSLEGLSPREQFELLDNALFVGTVDEVPEEYYLMEFLTNVSEVFDDVKAFLVSPSSEDVMALVKLLHADQFISHRI